MHLKNGAVILLKIMNNNDKVDPGAGFPEKILHNTAAKHLLNKYIDFVTIAVCRKEESAEKVLLPTSTTASNIVSINSMVIFRAKFSQQKKASHRRQTILKNFGMSLLYPWLQQQKSRKFQKILNRHYENVDSKLTLIFSNSLESAKVDGVLFFLSLLERKISHVCHECDEQCCIDKKQVTDLFSCCAA